MAKGKKVSSVTLIERSDFNDFIRFVKNSSRSFKVETISAEVVKP